MLTRRRATQGVVSLAGGTLTATQLGSLLSGAAGAGAALKSVLRQPGPWLFYLLGFGEMLADARNRAWLDPKCTDGWGVPLLHIDCEHRENGKAMIQATSDDAAEIMRAAGLQDIRPAETILAPPGLLIHEMGTARMGRDPRTSVLNEYNQAHSVPNLFVTDGSAMASSACQNPSLTYMALTARESAAAVEMLKAGSI